MRCIWQEAEELSALFQFCLLGSLHLWRVAVELTPCSRLPDSETDSEVTAGVTAPRPGSGRLQSHSCDSFIPVLIPVMRDADVIKSWDRNGSSTSFLLWRRNFLFLCFSFSLPEFLDGRRFNVSRFFWLCCYSDLLAVLVTHLIHPSNLLFSSPCVKFCCCCPPLAVSLFRPFFVIFLVIYLLRHFLPLFLPPRILRRSAVHLSEYKYPLLITEH